MVSCSTVSQQHVSQDQETHDGFAHVFAGSAYVGQLLALHGIDLASDGRLRHAAKTTLAAAVARDGTAHLEVVVAAVLPDDHALVHLGTWREEQHAAVLQRLKRIRNAGSHE